ncbi:zinc ribbon domain-containing protein [Planctomycetota bacterium]|nr:zinc ribbon domain-containing protein [Planctomycetota bacterium]
MIEVRCEKCERLSHIPEALIGQVVKCRGCGKALNVQEDDGATDEKTLEKKRREEERLERAQKEQERIQAEMGRGEVDSEWDMETVEQQQRFDGLSDAVMGQSESEGEAGEGSGWDLQQLATTQVEEVGEQANEGWVGMGDVTCPQCGEVVRDGALLCVSCGHVLGDMDAIEQAAVQGRQGVVGGLAAGVSAMLGGASTAIVGGACWAAVSVAFGKELGGIAFVMGLVIAFVMVKLAGGAKHWMLGAMAVLMLVLAIGVGKVGIAFYGLSEMRSRSGVKEMRMLEAAVVKSLIAEGAFDRETSEKLRAVDWEAKQELEMREREYEKVAEKMRKLNDAQKVGLVKKYWIEPKVKGMSGQERLKAVVSQYELIWLGLGALGAFMLAGFGHREE